MGFRCGFLGLLHMEVFVQRLEQEYGVQAIITAPTVPYRVVQKDHSVIEIHNPSQFPEDDYREVTRIAADDVSCDFDCAPARPLSRL